MGKIARMILELHHDWANIESHTFFMHLSLKPQPEREVKSETNYIQKILTYEERWEISTEVKEVRRDTAGFVVSIIARTIDATIAILLLGRGFFDWTDGNSTRNQNRAKSTCSLCRNLW